MSRRKHELSQIDRMYLTHRICFACRASFKRVVGTDAPCPMCGGRTVNLGRKFKPPKKSDDAQWRKVRLLYEGGYWEDHRYASWSWDAKRRAYAWIPPVETLREARKLVRPQTEAELVRRRLHEKKREMARHRPRRRGGRRYRQAGGPLTF